MCGQAQVNYIHTYFHFCQLFLDPCLLYHEKSEPPKTKLTWQRWIISRGSFFSCGSWFAISLFFLLLFLDLSRTNLKIYWPCSFPGFSMYTMASGFSQMSSKAYLAEESLSSQSQLFWDWLWQKKESCFFLFLHATRHEACTGSSIPRPPTDIVSFSWRKTNYQWFDLSLEVKPVIPSVLLMYIRR